MAIHAKIKMMFTDILNFDYQLFRFFNGFAGRSQTLDYIFIFFSEYLVFLLVAGLALFVLLKPKNVLRQKGVIEGLAAAFIGRGIIDSIIRAFFFRPRPFVSGTVTQLVEHNPLEAAFPSGHATIMFAVAFALFFYDKRWGTIYLLLAAASSIARIAVGVHFPFDILGGLAVGFFSALISKRLVSFWYLRKQKKEVSPR